MNAEPKQPFQRILWAIDPFTEDPRLQFRAAEALATLTVGSQVPIEPVYLLRPNQPNLFLEFYPGWIEQYRAAADTAIAQFLSQIKAKLPGLRPPKILIQNSSSLREGVEVLNKYAAKNHFNLIVCSTHANKGIARFLLGSFAETLLLYSKLPILVVSPSMTTLKRVDHILVPTDFSDASHEALQSAISLAKGLAASLTIFHHVSSPVSIPGLNLDASKAARLEEEADSWAKIAENFGVKAEVLVDKHKENVAQAILAAAKKKSGIIVMASQSGIIETAFIGSVTRQVIRAASIPVWVVHPRAK